MKLRMCPFGYKIKNGETIIDQNEAEYVREIFTLYCNGASLKQLAGLLNDKAVVFKEGGQPWNKSRVSHILMDKRYLGDDVYLPIIDADLFEKANRLKEIKGITRKSLSNEVEYLKKILVCGICGGKFIRFIDHQKKECWVCANGCRLGHRPTDEKLLAAIRTIALKATQNPELLLKPTPDAGYKRTTEIMRISNEILRMNEQIATGFHTGKTLLFQIAAKKFLVCKEDKSVYTDYVLGQIKRIEKSGCVDVEFLQNVVNKIKVTGKNEYIVEFINGAEVTNRRDT